MTKLVIDERKVARAVLMMILSTRKDLGYGGLADTSPMLVTDGNKFVSG